MSDATPDPTRRSILDALLGVGLVGWVGSILYPVLRYLTPLGQQAQSGPVKLSAEEQAKLDKDHSVIVRAGSGRVLVFQDGNQTLRAISAKCTHEGCTVQYVPGDSVIWCACHNGRFDLEGKVLSGPPPRPLAAYTAQRLGDGAVIVQLGKKTEGA
jgi:Rieske Fe-S protein